MKVFEAPGFKEEEKLLNASYRCVPSGRQAFPRSLGLFGRLELMLYEREFEAGHTTPIPFFTWAARSFLKIVPRLKSSLKK